MAEPIYFINNKFFPASKAYLPISDLSIMRGYGVFEFLITYNHQPFLLKEHLDRLSASAQTIDLELPKSLSEIERLVLKTLKKNLSKKEKAIRIIVTGGQSLPPAFTQAKGKSTLIITVDPKHQYPSACYKHGVKVITYEHTRQIPEAKTLNYLAAIKAQKQARRQGAIEAIYVFKGKITESTTSNFFVVINNRIITPKSNILLGVTRQKVLELAKPIAPIKERSINIKEISAFQEAFITSSSKEIMPIVQIDNQRIGRGKIVTPGPITQKLIAKFSAFINKKSPI